ncbi:bifunctional diguanylate cyclase/phosphodiesterase [Pseudoalteromonas sp. S16_S37]|uniref:bifunctional diguanylate cyclase/phosphodiesterase n=1 Tax=Pseudoalteromonas sp. S16_S37 TaxID=2720228 RepID=UPI001681BB6E|nr:EAL domain-containing protein [Pseudoalteromonas sp. S16_S37]MBD1582099.1 EAL domain-containing protein [Pseudoalteromonas sp. S16_S37]
MGTSLKHRIIMLCVGLVLLTAVSSLVSFWWSTSHFNESQVQQDMQVAKNVYQQYLKAKERLLVTAATVLTADFGFKQAVATRDADTISSVLYNHSQRIDADLMLLFDTQGKLISADKRDIELPSDTSTLLKQLLAQGNSSTFMVINEALYQVIVLPVKAPRTIAYSMVGFVIDTSVAKELKELTGMEISFIATNTGLKTTTLLGHPPHLTLLEYIDSQIVERWFGEDPVYLSAKLQLPGLEDNPIRVVLSADLSEHYQEFDKLVLTVILLSFGTIILGFITSGILASNLATPLQQLTVMAKQFAQGNYRAKISESRPSKEVCELVDAFQEMGADIQTREKQIRFQARHDSLTGFYNRTAALDLLSQHTEQESAFYLVALDIKGLRHINDKLGPRVGDSCIQAVAQRIKESTQGLVGFNARLGGDEFLSVIEVSSNISKQQRVAQLQQALNQHYEIQNLEITLRFSIGVVQYPEQAQTPEDMVRRALIAVDTAAQDRHEVYFYQNGEDEAHLERLQIIDELKHALHNDDGQLFMAYQPKLNINSGQIDKVEALIRWQRNNGEWVSPELFIDLAEQSGLIVELTQWVVCTVVAQVGTWLKEGLTMKAAINVSAQDIAHSEFLNHLENQLIKHAVPAKLITIELTERDMIENEEQGINTLKALKSLGVMISLDDYGVGQTSLGRLKMLPIDELKLDKVFILKLNESHQDQCIVQSTISLGHQLGFSVVSEGVENLESLNLLKQMRCDYAQGYHLSRPLPAREFLDWLGNYNEVG